MAQVVAAGTGGLQKLESSKLDSLKQSVRVGEYNLFIGAGVSLDAVNAKGPLPSGVELKQRLCKLVGARPNSSLQRVFSGLTPDQVDEFVTDRFSNCEPGATSLMVPSFVWRRVFTLNIDNVIEAAYKRPGNLQNVKTFHFRDAFEELRTLETVPIIHLHGDAMQPRRGYVFARSEYARAMVEANAWMTVLADLMPVEPFVIAGTSLDEIDLEFYLARRSANSSREDRGPSFYVEPFPDAQTPDECQRYGLILYHGTMMQFLQEIAELVPERPAPFNLLAGDTKGLFPEGTPKGVVLSFANDFDRVPTIVAPNGEALKFSYGNPPEWSDLAGNWDVGRRLASRVRSMAEAMMQERRPERVLLITDRTGCGKTTVLRRVGFDLAAAGVTVLDCSALSRIDSQMTAEALDLIDDPVVILIDNLAEQASSISNVIAAMTRRDVIFICAERDYRRRHIVSSFGDTPFRVLQGLELIASEAMQLVQSYVKRGLSATPKAITAPTQFAAELEGEPVAVACCHILNDFRPLDSIVQSTYDGASQGDRDRYLLAALAQFCFSGGVRYEVLTAKTSIGGLSDQFKTAHPLPLSYFDPREKKFIIPLNATIAVRTLERAPKADIARAFINLALGIAPRVNREAIRKRMPEARLASRLFDYEDVISRFLRDGAGHFYANVQPMWKWNSRYWEQVALFELARYRSEGDELFLQQAVQHSRHAVAIEKHPFTLTTLGKVLLSQLGQPGMSNTATFDEAEANLVKAIEIEQARNRASVHAYVTLFRGALEFMRLDGSFDGGRSKSLLKLVESSQKYFPRDKELRDLADQLAAAF